MNKNAQSRPYWLTLGYISFVLFLASLLGFVGLYVAQSQKRTQIDIVNVSPPAAGGEGCIRVLYDQNGKSHSYLRSWETYTGTAPLFLVEPAIIGRVTANECFNFPKEISPTLALKGKTFYPVVIDVTVDDERLRPGESTVLTARASVVSTFTKSSLPLSLSPSSTVSVTFSLLVTGLRFSPKNEEADLVILSLNEPAYYKWIITPEDNSLGNQHAMVALKELDGLGPNITFKVWSSSIINPIVSTLVGFISGIVLGVAKPIFDIWFAYRQMKDSKQETSQKEQIIKQKSTQRRRGKRR